SKLHDVEEKLQEVLILTIAALHRENEVWEIVFQRESRRQRDARMLSRFDHVEWTLRAIENEALHALAQSDSAVTADDRPKPAAAGRHRNRPPFGIGCFDGCRAGIEATLRSREFSAGL